MKKLIYPCGRTNHERSIQMSVLAGSFGHSRSRSLLHLCQVVQDDAHSPANRSLNIGVSPRTNANTRSIQIIQYPPGKVSIPALNQQEYNVRLTRAPSDSSPNQPSRNTPASSTFVPVCVYPPVDRYTPRAENAESSQQPLW